MTIQQFINKYGTHTASAIIRELAPDNRKEVAEELARDLQSALEHAFDQDRRV